MEEKRMVFKEGKKDCPHEWRKENQDWDEAPGTGPIMSKLPKWQYHATVRVCRQCGREELVGGTVVVPETPGYTVAGEYTLEPNGNRGLFIS